MRIAFVWQGIREHVNRWNDGLREALRTLERRGHSIAFHEPDDDFGDRDILLYWEAPCTVRGPNGGKYERVRSSSGKKVLLFAGGPMERPWVEGFNLLCVESRVNEEDCARLGIPYVRAFGINDRVYKPFSMVKRYAAIHHGTCASWKRQWLVAEAFGKDALLIGHDQRSDPEPFARARQLGAHVEEWALPEMVAIEINKSSCCCQTSDAQGGGQRATLEAMACGIPVICMSDSPKNREFVEESGAGVVCEPNAQAIRAAFSQLTPEMGERGIAYVHSKWTARHYADALESALASL